MYKLFLFATLFLSSCHLAKRSAYQQQLTTDLTTGQRELAYIKKLQEKNSQKLAANDIYDSVYYSFASELQLHHRHADSLVKEMEFLKNRTRFRMGYLESYDEYRESVSKVHVDVQKKLPQREHLFQQIDKKLDEQNLGAEKKQLKTVLHNAAAQQDKDAAAVTAMGNTKDSLLAIGNIASAAATMIDSRLQNFEIRIDELRKEIKLLDKQLDAPSIPEKDFVIVKKRIHIVDSVVKTNAENNAYVITMIEDGMSKSKPNLFSLAAFFGAGGYTIPAAKSVLAQQYFSPIIDSLVKFSNQYASVNRTAALITDGYADAATIMPGTTLYKKIADYLGESKPSKAQLNAGLSALRAEEISKLLNVILKEKYPDFKTIDKIVFEFTETGKGEKLPDPTIKNYKTNDERRRIVIIYWSVLPNS
jgi:hypothetical protein